jgi:hypothetical protein
MAPERRGKREVKGTEGKEREEKKKNEMNENKKARGYQIEQKSRIE